MAGYSPLKITGNSTGLVQQREEFILPDDAYPRLQNAYVWRERIKRKKGFELLGRLQRTVTGFAGNTNGAGNFLSLLFISFGLESTSSFVPGSFTATVGAITVTEPSPPDGTLLFNGVPAAPSFINWSTGEVGLVTGLAATAVNVSFDYYPGLPVMGIRTRELTNSTNDQTIFFDQNYAYVFNEGTNSFQEFIPGTTWNAQGEAVDGTSFFWSTNYWTSETVIPGTATPLFSTSGVKLFWETNNTGQFGVNADPPRITDGITWVDFYDDTLPATNSPWAQIDAATPNPNFLTNFLSMLPFRGRMVTFNTWEGPSATGSINYSNRIRWSQIGNPFTPFAAGPPTTGAWRDDIRGRGGYLDIPTSEDIVSIGFVRDNLVIYCERSTWQLRYTGRTIAPFQIEKVNSELGGEGPFSAVQFDTSLVGIGDKGIVECDSYKSERIDIKIPDFVFEFQNGNDGPSRVHGIRDFINRLAFWTIPLSSSYDAQVPADSKIFPNQRLVYNYENDSWALFDDSLTALGTYQPQSSRTWLNTPIPWIQCNFSWIGTQAQGIPSIVGGNQQGFVEYLNEKTVNDPSLFISAIQANTTAPTVVTSPNHNLTTGMVIGIKGIPTGTPFDNLNNGIFGIILGDNAGADTANKFRLMIYDPLTRQFSTPQLDTPPVPPMVYVGGGVINLRENFSILSKKFNFLDEGQSIQLGYVDVLIDATETGEDGAISLNVYLDYNENEASNTLPRNEINNDSLIDEPDTFFNSVIPTVSSSLNGIGGTKFWQRVYCPTRANFLTLEYTFSNAQLAGEEQTKNVQIDAQILWIRKAGRLSQI
jgi:hypothetical protein